VRDLYTKLAERNLAGRRKIKGVGPRRAEIIVPGVAVLVEFLRSFHLPAVYYSRAGVRDGIIADLAARNVGAELSRLSRDQRAEVENMCRRYAVPVERVRKAAEVSNLLFTCLHPVHQLPPAAGKLIEAAACLLDTGHYVSGVAHHKHSYYLVSNSDMPGFTERERLLIAALCRYHRKSLPQPTHQAFQSLTADERRVLLQAIPVLRLADSLNRNHQHRISGVECRLREGQIQLMVRSEGDIDLEQWGAEKASDVFQQFYGRTVTIQKMKEG
jgi:exopolyphosphatase/guanosine-5'-triphosphate,3'-diphosphate pyrophosphatase